MEPVSLSDEDAVEAVDGVHLAQLASGDRMSVQHYDFEPGATVPEHDHEHEQSGFVYNGVLTLLINGEEVVCGPGDSYVIPGDTPHSAENRGEDPVRGIDVFSPPRPNPNWEE
jgi:quercetin dioxygenase-like cupin family protein